jgi:hypothetical protein
LRKPTFDVILLSAFKESEAHFKLLGGLGDDQLRDQPSCGRAGVGRGFGVRPATSCRRSDGPLAAISKRSHRSRRATLGLPRPGTVAAAAWALFGLAAAAAAALRPSAAPAPGGLRILSDVALPPALAWASDVRWASERSVYLAVPMVGIVEVSVDPAGPPPREAIPGSSKPGGFRGCQRVAASSTYLVAAAPVFSLTWRRLDDPIRKEAAFEVIEAIDARENQLVVVGARRDGDGKFGADGAIAWIGSLDKQLADLRPLLFDVAGAGVPTMNRCLGTQLAATRFLADGSLLVLPGVQPGLSLYDRQGKLLRTWDTAAMGIDADCPGLSEAAGARLARNGRERQLWLNQRRGVDAVVPLPEGPGLVVRRVEKNRTLWDLKLIRRGGPPASVAVPIEGPTEFYVLAGDARAGTIVFLLREKVFRGGARTQPAPPHLIIASLAAS